MGFGLFFHPGQESREDESVFNSPTLTGWLCKTGGGWASLSASDANPG